MILCYYPFSIVVIISGFTGVDLKKKTDFLIHCDTQELVYQSIFGLENKQDIILQKLSSHINI